MTSSPGTSSPPSEDTTAKAAVKPAKSKAAATPKAAKAVSKYALRPLVSHFIPLINARFPVVSVSTDDEDRMFETEKAALTQAGVAHIYVWNATTNLKEENSQETAVVRNMRELIVWFAKRTPENHKIGTSKDLVDQGKFAPNKSALFIFDGEFYLQPDTKNAHSNPAITREIIQSLGLLREQFKTIFIIGGTAGSKIAPELATRIPSLVYPLPSKDALHNTVCTMRKAFLSDDDVRAGRDTGPEMSEEDIERIVQVLMGLNKVQASRILTKSVVENIAKRKSNPEHPKEFDFELIVKEKRELTGDHKAIRVEVPRPRHSGDRSAMDRVGGMKPLKDYLVTRGRLFHNDARGDGIKIPKGVFIFGMGGTGKDLVIEQAAQELGMVALYADMGANKSQLQGASHESLRMMLQFAEDQAPCILVLSEFEKMMAGAMNTSGAVCDAGTGSEMFATWLNWMQNRTAPILVVALANSIEGVSQPALRAGRFNSIWFADLPDAAERIDIFSVHLGLTGWDPASFNLERLAAETEGFTGAEIEVVVSTALEEKYLNEGSRQDGVMLEQRHLEAVIPGIHSTGKTRRKEVEGMRAFAKEGGYRLANHRPAASTADVVKDLTALAQGESNSEQL